MSPPTTPIIAHERLAGWTGRLRPRFAGDAGVRWVESRSTADLVAAATGRNEPNAAPATDPVVLIDLGGRPYWGLEGLDALHQVRPDALTLVLDPGRTPDLAVLARELGATLVTSGVAVPPRVEALLRRWVELARERHRDRTRRAAGVLAPRSTLPMPS